MKRSTREALYVHAEGCSQISGEVLTDSWEVDHKTPRAAGGTDAMDNLQAVTQDENRAKSVAHPPVLLEWQQEFIRAWERETTPSFLLVALPGAGKTIASLAVAQEWITADPTRRKVIVVVPTDALRNQWQQEAAALYGLQFQSREFESWKSAMVGFILTYQGLAGHSQLWQLRCYQYQILVICDEIHHASDRNDWGFQLREAFSGAGRRLLTSGTPFRGDSTRIPFVNYDSEGLCVPHYRYDYPFAIRDGIIRVVRFQHEKGIVRCLTPLGEMVSELSSEIPEDEANDTLGQILRPGKYTEELLRLSHTQLLRCRERMPQAGALAICRDQDHAEQIAKQLKGITGEAPDLIISDDDRATSTVESFRASARMWVVAVRQISEGVDIRRLMVLTYLTNYRTSLFFRQAVGRIVRYMGTPEDTEAYCVIPDHPVLVQHALKITEAQDQAIDESEEEFQGAVQRVLPLNEPTLDMVLGTEHTGSAGTIIEGQALSPDAALSVTALAQELICSEQIALRVWKKFGSAAAAPVTGEVLRSPQRPLEQQLDAARRLVARAVKRTAFRLLAEDPEKFVKVNMYVARLTGKTRPRFDLEDCRHVIAHLSGLMKWS
jgi:superfamily II DNA or RNA helicase